MVSDEVYVVEYTYYSKPSIVGIYEYLEDAQEICNKNAFYQIKIVPLNQYNEDGYD